MTIKILFLAANPSDTRLLSLDEEIRDITQKVNAATHRDSIQIIQAWAARPDDLLQALNQHKPHVVHFSGHGSKSEQIYFNGDDGQSKPVGKHTLSALFATLKDNIQVVVLNACYSAPQAEAITEHIPFAIGMNKSIGDVAAITFAASFYRAVAFGRSVQEAFDQANVSLMLENIAEEDTPQLISQQNVKASEVRLINPSMPL